ncbi:MAG: type II toxin-antitoxin system VapC family toxin [Burkholderiales bacterium]
MSIPLDTHVWIWWLTPNSPLKPKDRVALDMAVQRQPLALSAISLWETQILYSKRRLNLPLPFADWLMRATDARMISVLPLDRDVVIALDSLPASFHGDPADRIIVATARAHALPLATQNGAIRRTRLVTLWKP